MDSRRRSLLLGAYALGAAVLLGCSGQVLLEPGATLEAGVEAANDHSAGLDQNEGGADHKDVSKDYGEWFDGNWGDYWTTCEGGLDRGPPPAGTPDCPADLNLAGCPCETAGVTAPCWTGERKNRNRGACHDGTTTCLNLGEFGPIWGECSGEKLPTPGATSGKEACLCLSKVKWRIENVAPCLWKPPDFVAILSTISSGDPSNPYQCPKKEDAELYMSTGTPPPTPWSQNFLTADCAGVFDLCYELRAGSVETASPSDCLVARVCSHLEYSKPKVEQQATDLPGWITLDAACAKRFWNEGAYGKEWMSGLSLECEYLPERVIDTIIYCPTKCMLEENKTLKECQACTNPGPQPDWDVH